MRVFDEIERILEGGSRHPISSFEYLNQSTRPAAMCVRNLIEEMFSRYPTSNQASLRHRLRDANDIAHDGALFELLLHELFVREGCKILAVEPPIEGTGRSPDFLVKTSGGSRFYVEATLAVGQSNVEAGTERRLKDVLAAIDALTSPDFFLCLLYRGMPTRPIAVKRLQQKVQAWIDGLDYVQVLTAREHNRSEVPKYRFAEHGIQLTIEPFPRTNTRGVLEERALGTISPGALFAVGGQVSIKKAVVSKAQRYGELSLPYIVAVNAYTRLGSRDSVLDALFGTEAISSSAVDDEEVWQITRVPNGAWRGPKGPRNTNVSAVLSVEKLTAWSLGQRRVQLTLNPWARRQLETIPLRADLNQIEAQQVSFQEGLTIAEILGLVAHWPEV